MTNEPQTETERELYKQLEERTRERDNAEESLARIRAALETFYLAFEETLAQRAKRAGVKL